MQRSDRAALPLFCCQEGVEQSDYHIWFVATKFEIESRRVCDRRHAEHHKSFICNMDRCSQFSSTTKERLINLSSYTVSLTDFENGFKKSLWK